MSYSDINPAWDRMHRTRERQLVQETLVKEPYWTDHCTHGHDCYVGSFIHRNPHEKIDVYVYPDDYYGQEVCLRYGEDDYQYFSPTGIAALIRSSVSMPLYARAVELLMEKGKIKWVKNERTT